MGLDIVAIRQGELAENAANLTDEELERHGDLITVIEGDFPDRLDGLEPGIYRFDPKDEFQFRVGPYSYYGWWRNQLCQLVLGISYEEFIENWDFYENKPFFELFFFSDCAGAIGPFTSAKLFKDFESHHDKATQKTENDFFSTYQNFQRAFDVAALHGFVVFM